MVKLRVFRFKQHVLWDKPAIFKAKYVKGGKRSSQSRRPQPYTAKVSMSYLLPANSDKLCPEAFSLAGNARHAPDWGRLCYCYVFRILNYRLGLKEGTQCPPITLSLDLTERPTGFASGVNDSPTKTDALQTYDTDVTKRHIKNIQHKEIDTLWFFNSQTFCLKSHEQLLILSLFYIRNTPTKSRTQRPRGLRRGSAAAPLLGLWVRIPPRVWMFVSAECCALSSRGLCVGLITRSEFLPSVTCLCDHESSIMRKSWPNSYWAMVKKIHPLRHSLSFLWNNKTWQYSTAKSLHMHITSKMEKTDKTVLPLSVIMYKGCLINKRTLRTRGVR
jgi:hypothetical protein